MKANFYIIALIVLFACYFSFGQDNLNSTKINHDFEVGEHVFVFGNNVKLRSSPKIESEVLKLLKIGEWIKIVEKTKFSWPYRGYDSPFYKVKYDTTEGYILGGLLAVKKKTIAGNDYYFAFSKEEERSYLNIRHIVKGKYSEQKIPLAHTNLSIQTIGNRGIYDLDDILYVDYHSEACGTEGGGIYFFAQGNELYKVGQFSQISDADAFHQFEKLIFPKDENGIPGIILFNKEKREVLDEESEWVQTTTETRKLVWIEGELVPEFGPKLSN
ncbi:SH3 domain-containing protein [Flagellimonas meridianipacifica]|uniref:SH3 domain-containing protein n=1 Tax=Flagellimonas meridianipacifica TaxID=1080225 RepID=A0A2T0MEP3_9FLAO|nr:SH3 domain-containing protein [Allomuricauda pacifica]PRX56033.1 hypothetical protein CLV81_0021 [Allomuricauda pacifica]